MINLLLGSHGDFKYWQENPSFWNKCINNIQPGQHSNTYKTHPEKLACVFQNNFHDPMFFLPQNSWKQVRVDNFHPGKKKQTPPHSVFVGYHVTSAKKSPTRLQWVDATVAVVVRTEGTGRRVKNCLISQGVPGYPPGNGYISAPFTVWLGKSSTQQVPAGTLEGNIVETTHAVSGCTSKQNTFFLGKREGLGGQSQKWNQQKFKNQVKHAGFRWFQTRVCWQKKWEIWKHGSMLLKPCSHTWPGKWWPDAPQTTTMKPYSQDTHGTYETWLRFTPSNLLELRHPRIYIYIYIIIYILSLTYTRIIRPVV